MKLQKNNKFVIIFFLVLIIQCFYCVPMTFDSFKIRDVSKKTETEIQKLYDLVKFEKKNDSLIIKLPYDLNCFEKCNDIDLCESAAKMIECYDEDLDLKISLNELDEALEHLSFFEKKMAGGAKKQMARFDGMDGSKKDNCISYSEFVNSELYCFEYKHMESLCNKHCGNFINVKLTRFHPKFINY